MEKVKVRFRGKKITIMNQSKKETAFTSDWNGYKIRLRKYKNVFRVKVTSPFMEEILSDSCTTIKSGISKSFEAIETDISEMEYMQKNKLFLLASTNGSFADIIKEKESVLATIEY